MPKISQAVEPVTERIRQDILTGRHRAGSRLVERTLSAELDVSRIPVREALRTLVAEGLATERPTGGIAVREHTWPEVEQLIEISHSLDAIAAARLLGASTDTLAPLDEAVQRAATAIDAGDHSAATGANALFHDALISSSPATLVAEVAAPLRTRLSWLLRHHDDPAAILAEHRDILTALRLGDAAALTTQLDRHRHSSLLAAENLENS